MWILRSLMRPISLVMVWSTIHSVFYVGLGLGNPNHFHSSFVMMFTLDASSNRTSSTIFLPTWTYIIAMWGSIATKVIIGLGLSAMTVFLPRVNLATTHCFKSRAISNVGPKERYVYSPIVIRWYFQNRWIFGWTSTFGKSSDAIISDSTSRSKKSTFDI